MTRRMSSTIPYEIPDKVQTTKIRLGLQSPYEGFAAPACLSLPPVAYISGINTIVYSDIPVAASTMRRMTVIRAKIDIATARTVRVGRRLTNGAIRMAPTHCAA